MITYEIHKKDKEIADSENKETNEGKDNTEVLTEQ